MDLEHPDITRTLRTGYPNKNRPAVTGTIENMTNLDYIKDEEDYQMKFEDLTLKELQDMGADIKVFFYDCKSKEEAQDIIEKLGLKERQYVEDYGEDKLNWIDATDYKAMVSAFYEETSNE